MIIQYYKGDFKHILDNVTDIKFQHSIGEKDKKYTMEEFWKDCNKYDRSVIVTKKETIKEIDKSHKRIVTFTKDNKNYLMIVIEDSIVYICNDNGKTIEQLN